MNDVSTHTSKPVTSRRRKPATVRTYHTALHEVGASRLTDEELAIVTKALVILENKVIRQGDVFDSPARAKPWLILHYGMLDREVFGLVFLDNRHRLPWPSTAFYWHHRCRLRASATSRSLGL